MGRKLMGRGACAVLIIAMLSLTACGTGETDDPDGEVGQEVQPEVFTATVTDEAVSFVPTLEAEPVIVEIDNQAKFEAHPAFARLKDDVMPTQVTRQFSKNPEGVLEMVVIAGSTEAVNAGSSLQAVFEFVPGSYLVTDPEARGMKPAFFEVVAATGPAVADPGSDGALEVGDFYFEFPEGIASGDVDFVVSNAGEQSHEVVISKGKREVGFFLAPVPGGRSWQTVRLPTPGRYTAVCYFPDPKSGKPHVKLGMKTTFEVS